VKGRVQEIRRQFDHDLAAARDAAALEQVRTRYVGRKAGLLTLLLRDLRDVPADERAIPGKAVNELKTHVETALEAARGRVARGEGKDGAIDLTLPGRSQQPGTSHPVTQVRALIEEIFLEMGYTLETGPEVETDFYNFEALNMPPAHPARSMWDTLYVKLGRPEEVVLRTHTSPVQIRVMESRQPPVYTVMPGRCYRRDTLDARHSPVFHQIEGLVVDRGITFGDLAGTIDAFTRAYFGPGHTSRLRPSYFPFTEPSAEFEVTCFVCDGAGCSVCSKTGWLELGGCGMVDPNVFRAVGYDSETYTGFAFGFGLERMAMVRYGVDHIKTFFENDVRFLKQF